MIIKYPFFLLIFIGLVSIGANSKDMNFSSQDTVNDTLPVLSKINQQKLKVINPGKNDRLLLTANSADSRLASAQYLAQSSGLQLYRVDLSRIISKYIGETEKNLDHIFDSVKSTEWVLFFDEADALFGKRTPVKDSHDRYANQEVSYLMQKMEAYQGLVILATNSKVKTDSLFRSKFRYVIELE